METKSEKMGPAWYARNCNAEPSSILQHEQFLQEDLGCGEARLCMKGSAR